MGGLIVIDTSGPVDGVAKKQSVDDASSLFSDDDDESIGSILSSDDENPGPSNLKQLELEFLMRDKLLDQLVEGMDPLYARMIRENERADRKEKLLRIHQHQMDDGTRRTSMSSSHSSINLKSNHKKVPLLPQDQMDDRTQSASTSSHSSKNDPKSDEEKLVLSLHKDQIDNGTQRTSISSHSSRDSSNGDEKSSSDVVNKTGSVKGKSCSGTSSFLMQNRLQGALILILNCIAYNGGEQIVRSFVVFLSQDEEFENRLLLPAIMMLFSFLVLCLTGGIWDYVNDDAYCRIKDEMKERHLQGRWDAGLLKFFRKYEPIRTALNVLAFFIYVYCVYIFQEHVMLWAFDMRHELFQGLPSVQQGVMTYPSMKLASLLTEKQIQDAFGDEACAASLLEQDELLQNLTRQDEEYLTSEMALDCYEDLMGDPTASIVTEATLFWYYMSSVIVAVVALRMMGHKFWSI